MPAFLLVHPWFTHVCQIVFIETFEPNREIICLKQQKRRNNKAHKFSTLKHTWSFFLFWTICVLRNFVKNEFIVVWGANKACLYEPNLFTFEHAKKRAKICMKFTCAHNTGSSICLNFKKHEKILLFNRPRVRWSSCWSYRLQNGSKKTMLAVKKQ